MIEVLAARGGAKLADRGVIVREAPAGKPLSRDLARRVGFTERVRLITEDALRQLCVGRGRAIATVFLIAALLAGGASAQSSRDEGSVCFGGDPHEALARYLRSREIAVERLAATRSVALSARFGEIGEALDRYTARRAAVLMYHLEERIGCALLAMRGGGLRYFALPAGRAQLAAAASELRSALGAQPAWAARSGDRGFAPLAHETDAAALDAAIEALSALVFPPALGEALSTQRVVAVAPAYEIGSLPLALLRLAPEARPAIERIEFRILPFLRDVESTRPAARGFDAPVIVGNPRPSRDVEARWVPLPGAESEARQIHEALGGRLLLREEARVETVVEAMQDADYIHVAAHGFVDPREPIDNSFLVLADGRLDARRIQSMTLRRGPLVVLSACHTGEGQALEAGVIGLARAFQLAGASETVISLWAVDDAATAELMVDLALRMELGWETGMALRSAALSLRARRSDPRIWAAFTVFGP